LAGLNWSSVRDRGDEGQHEGYAQSHTATPRGFGAEAKRPQTVNLIPMTGDALLGGSRLRSWDRPGPRRQPSIRTPSGTTSGKPPKAEYHPL
jgi:hypothetical protein